MCFICVVFYFAIMSIVIRRFYYWFFICLEGFCIRLCVRVLVVFVFLWGFFVVGLFLCGIWDCFCEYIGMDRADIDDFLNLCELLCVVFSNFFFL